MKLVPEKPFTLKDMQRCYRLNDVLETRGGFYVIPSSPYQGNELFFLPYVLPIKDLERKIPYDLIASIPQDIIADIVKALDIKSVFDDTYSIEARFVNYDPNPIKTSITPQPMAVVKPVDPREAAYIQFTGVRDVYYNRGDIMCPPDDIEERLDFLSTHHDINPDRTQGYLYLEWLLPCDHRTRKIRREWAESCVYYDIATD